MASVSSMQSDRQLHLLVTGACEAGSDGNYIAQLVSAEFKKYDMAEITRIVVDLRQADYRFGDYLGSVLMHHFDARVHLRVLTNARNHPHLRSLAALMSAEGMDIRAEE